MKRTALAFAAAGLMAACASAPEIPEVPASAGPIYSKPPVPLNSDTTLGSTPTTAFQSAPPIPVPGAQQPDVGVTTNPVADQKLPAARPLACTAPKAAPPKPVRRPAKSTKEQATKPCAR